ncbi:MAG: outer membrane protein transport protein [Pseudomonadota bacterium]
MLRQSLTFLFATLSAPAFASGFALNAQNAETLGAAMAGAQAERGKPSMAYYNPAAIVGVDGVEASVSVFGVFVDSNYENATGALLGVAPVQGAAFGESAIGDGVFPDAAIAARLNDRLYFGVSFNTPFGFDSSYADDSVIRYHGTASKVVSISATPILGLALTDQWSIAGGVRIQYMDVSLDGAIDAAGIATASMIPGFTPGADDVFFSLDTDDFDIGYVAGIQGQVTPLLQVGASFTSKIEHDFTGDADFEIGASVAGQTLAAGGLFQDTGFTSEITAPGQYQLGAALDVSPRMTLLASTTLTRWSRFEQIVAVFDNPAQPPEVITQNWRDTWTGSAGAEFDLFPSSKARVGVMYEQTPLNDEFASPRIPDANRVWISAGLSQQLGPRAALHVGASYVFIGDRPIDQPATRPENLFRGSVSTDINVDALIVSAGLDFGF